MNIQEYSSIIEKTAVYPEKVDGFGICYAYLGIIGENSEYLEELNKFMNNGNNKEALIKEAGDVCWYVTLMAQKLHLNLNKIFTYNQEVVDNIVNGGDSEDLDSIAENLKKHYRDNKPINTEKVERVLIWLMSRMLGDFKFISEEIEEIKIEEVLKVNYDKLIRRKENNTIKGDGSNR